MGNTKSNVTKMLELREAKRQARIDKVRDYICAAGDKGVTCKELTIEFHIANETARQDIHTLMDRDLVAMGPKSGCANVFYWKDNVPAVEEPKEEKAEIPVGHSGKVFEPGTFVPVTDNCKAGDVIWISSRSGDGAFFRYLIITPWENKAMVLGIIEEGHPRLNLNDPYYVYIGDDPETLKHLYADLRNNCQRGYKQFGERSFHVEKDLLDDVKIRLARTMGIDRNVKKVVDNGTVELQVKISKLEAEKKSIEEGCTGRIENLKMNFTAERNELKEEIADLRIKLEDAYKETEKAKQLADTIQKERDDMIEEYDRMYEELNSSEAKTKDVEDRVNQELVLSMQEDIEKLQRTLSKYASNDIANTTKIELLEKQNDTLTKMVFCMIKGGKE